MPNMEMQFFKKQESHGMEAGIFIIIHSKGNIGQNAKIMLLI